MAADNHRMCGWFLIALCVLLCIAGSVAGEGKNWALLITGSSGYTDYGLQSDVCHAYHVFSAHGVPDERIVVMMYDDIAYNDLNPYPGELINQIDGPNVYPGVSLDYVGEHVTAQVFYAVLLGDREKVKQLTGFDGKVIDSGPDDHVFVLFASHGNIGILAMPDGKYVYATELNDALQTMHDQKKYGKLVFYLESCFAGSMFDEILPEDISIYAATSANSTEPASFCYFDYDRKACVGTYFVCAWLENCDEEDIRYETLQEQFEIIVEGTPYSHPQQYGDVSFTSVPVSEFIGKDHNSRRAKHNSLEYAESFIPVYEMEIFTLKQLLSDPRQMSRHEEIRAELMEKLWLQDQTDVFISSLVSAALPNKDADWVLDIPLTLKQRSTYEYAVYHLGEVCPRLRSSVNRFMLGKMNVLANLSNVLSLRHLVAAIDVAANTSPLC